MRETEHTTIDYNGNISNRGAIRGTRELSHTGYSSKETPEQSAEEKDRTNAQFGAKFAKLNGIDLDDKSWEQQAACGGSDNEQFFPSEDKKSLGARQICATCVVYEECATEGMLRPQEHGVWGGTIANHRKSVMPDLRRGLPWKAVINAVRAAHQDGFIINSYETEDPNARSFKKHYVEQVEEFESGQAKKTA